MHRPSTKPMMISCSSGKSKAFADAVADTLDFMLLN
jgi:hypothetical protein